MRLDKLLCEMNIGTRSQVKELIKKGRVTLNGIPEKSADRKVDENSDCVCLDGRQLCYRKYVYYMLHKPAGVVTATQDNRDLTVMDLLRDGEAALPEDLFPVGRLDKDTEGLLLITNDGALAHRLLSPAKHVDKTYYVECDGPLSPEAITLLQDGVDIGDDTKTRPARLQTVPDCEGPAYYLTITEGRFHQVKRMFQAVGRDVTYLKRLRMGSLELDSRLEKGAFRELTSEELERILL